MIPSSEHILPFFARYIENELGIIYAEHNYFQLENRLCEVARTMGVADLGELHALARRGICERFQRALLDVATNNETSFFRDPKIFRAIESTLLAPRGNANGERLHVWSAACSTGQEPLSIAMSIRSLETASSRKIPFSILATDISERALAKAMAATYSDLEVGRGLTPGHLRTHFTQGPGGTWQAKSDLSNAIEYKKMNLREPFPTARLFDLILCRNVLIYQSVESKRDILERMAPLLKPDGILVLGSSESLIGVTTAYRQELVEGAIIYRKSPMETKVAA